MSGKPIPVGDRFWKHVAWAPGDACWEWQGVRRANGYGQVGATAASGKKGMVSAHRVAYELTHGRIPAGLDVMHKCDNRACVRPDHLTVGTRSDNMQDAKAKGRLRVPTPLFGEAHPQAKITQAQAEEIRSATGLQREIAAKYGVSPATVSHIKTGRKWHA